jgi:uncharacterized membrane protein YkvA (DUF1232 family)
MAGRSSKRIDDVTDDISPLPGSSPAGHHIDDRVPRPARTTKDLITEALLLGPNLLLLLVRLLRDPRVPRRRKIVAGLAVAYLASPIDLVPDFVPVVGQVDDVVFSAFAVNHLLNGVPDWVQREYWAGSEDTFDLLRALIAWGSEMVPKPLRRLLNGPE